MCWYDGIIGMYYFYFVLISSRSNGSICTKTCFWGRVTIPLLIFASVQYVANEGAQFCQPWISAYKVTGARADLTCYCKSLFYDNVVCPSNYNRARILAVGVLIGRVKVITKGTSKVKGEVITFTNYWWSVPCLCFNGIYKVLLLIILKTGCLSPGQYSACC